MKKNKSIYISMVILICYTLLFSACFSFKDETGALEKDTTVATIAPPRESYSTTTIDETTTSSFEINMDVNAIPLDNSFDVLLDMWAEKLGENDPRTGSFTDENLIVYYSDYWDFLDEAMIEDSGGAISYTPEEYEYHITESFFVDSMGFYMYEFETTEWANNAFCSDLNDVYEISNEITLYDYSSDGYFFVRYDGLNFYQLEYYVDNCIIIYHFSLNNGTSEQLLTFLDICDSISIPSCDELTDEVLQ